VFAEGALWGAAQAAGLPVAAGLPHHRTQSPECAGHLAVHQLQLRPVSSVAAAAAAHAAAVDTHPVTGHPITPSSPRHSLRSIRPSSDPSAHRSSHTRTHTTTKKAHLAPPPPTRTSQEPSHPTTHQTKDTGKRT